MSNFWGSLHFDLQNDPDELCDLSGLPEYADLAQQLESAILQRFSPQETLDYLQASLRRRRVVNHANKLQQLSWDFTPDFPGRDRYVR